MAFWVAVHGPNINGVFGNSESWTIESPTDVEETETGSLTILTAARPEGFHVTTGERYKARPPQRIYYPRGEWTKVRIGEVTPKEES